MRTLTLIGILVISACFSFGQDSKAAGQVDDLIVARGETHTISSSLTILNSLILEENATLKFAENIESWQLQTNLLVLNPGSKIDARGKNGVIVTGNNDRAGKNGISGSNGVHLDIQVVQTLRWGSFIIDTSGGTGSNGTVGLRGKKGTNSKCCTRSAGTGDRGGAGGNGGNGGNAGNISIRYREQIVLGDGTITEANFVQLGGSPGSRAKGGPGGKGGNKSSGCFPGCNQSRGARGREGTAGSGGLTGNSGTRSIRPT
jgi:hypothetical protein